MLCRACCWIHIHSIELFALVICVFENNLQHLRRGFNRLRRLNQQDRQSFEDVLPEYGRDPDVDGVVLGLNYLPLDTAHHCAQKTAVFSTGKNGVLFQSDSRIGQL